MRFLELLKNINREKWNGYKMKPENITYESKAKLIHRLMDLIADIKEPSANVEYIFNNCLGLLNDFIKDPNHWDEC